MGSSAKSTVKVFLCHSSDDKPAVKTLYMRLKADGYEPWLDAVNLLPGEDWDAEIKAAIRACHIIVVCLSKTAVSRRDTFRRKSSWRWT